ncbi:amino acid permease C-terminal domain-containing protein [Micromonospora sp. WMMD1076]|uniref:amino acid permease C-terminal domain-containing protein n=1 Tax=Micromonospora sp. WMMD1076 TaxID=3016103 RepID=UPI0032B4BAD1
MLVSIAAVAGLTSVILVDLVSIGALCAFAPVAIAVPIPRERRPDLERPFEVPFPPVLPTVTAVARLHLSLNLSVETWLRFLAWTLIGAVIHVGYGHRKNRPARREHSDTPEPAPTP